METRQPKAVFLSWRRKLKFTDHVVVDPVNTGVDIAHFLNDKVQVSVVNSSPNYIDTLVCFLAANFFCKISWLYGNAHINEKQAFWGSMYSSFPHQSIPWLCLGDFNEILWHREKWGGLAPDIWRLNLFQSFLSNGQLRDLNYQGPAFTWFTLRHGRVFIKMRLDRALGNSAWCPAQSRTRVFHLHKIGSDHCPILVDTLPMEISCRKLFRYEQLWNTHEDCSAVIKSSWLNSHVVPPMNTWFSNLGRCRSSLQSWSKITFPNSQAQVSNLIIDLEADSDLPNTYDQITGIIDNITTLW